MWAACVGPLWYAGRVVAILSRVEPCSILELTVKKSTSINQAQKMESNLLTSAHNVDDNVAVLLDI